MQEWANDNFYRSSHYSLNLLVEITSRNLSSGFATQTCVWHSVNLQFQKSELKKPRDNGNFYARAKAQQTGPFTFFIRRSTSTNTSLPLQNNRSASSFIIHPIFNHSQKEKENEAFICYSYAVRRLHPACVGADHRHHRRHRHQKGAGHRLPVHLRGGALVKQQRSA